MASPVANPEASRPAADTPAHSWHRRLTSPWCAALVGAICFLTTLSNGFVYDDLPIIVDNPRIRDLSKWRDIWLRDWWFTGLKGDPVGDPSRDRLYRPLSMFTFAVNHAIHGTPDGSQTGRAPWSAFGYRLANVSLHALACGLVWSLAWRLSRDRTVAIAAGLLFAVHPVHAEAVAQIVGRAEILATVFLLAGLIVLIPVDDRRVGPRRAALAALSLLAAMLSKETAVCGPALALTIAWAVTRLWKPDSSGGPGRLERTIGIDPPGVFLILLTIPIYFGLRYVALEGQLLKPHGAGILFNPFADLGLDVRLLGSLTVLGHYARLLFAPYYLSSDYGLAVIDPRAGMTQMTGIGVAALAFLLLGLALVYRNWRKPRENTAAFTIGVLTLLFLISYVLISNTVLLIGVTLAERLMYWPSVPALLAAAMGAVWLARRRVGASDRRSTLRLAAVGLPVLLLLGARSAHRGSQWSDDETLFTADVAVWPNSAHLSVSLARNLLFRAERMEPSPDRDGLIERSLELSLRALEISPYFPSAMFQLARVSVLQADAANAIRMCESVLALSPAHEEARLLLSELRGAASDARARIVELRARVAQRPDDAAAWLELGTLQIDLGLRDDAVPSMEQATRLAPELAAAWRGYGQALILAVRSKDAVLALRRAVELDPQDWESHTNIAALIYESDPAACLRHAEIAIRLNPEDIRVRSTYAEALVVNDRRAEALRVFEDLATRLPLDHALLPGVVDRIRDLKAGGP